MMTTAPTSRGVDSRIERLEALVDAQARILDLVGESSPLERVLQELSALFQFQVPGSIASILLANRDGTALVVASAPNLDAAYSASIDPLPIAEGSASCGTAAWRKESVVVEDIACDAKWAALRDVARVAGLRACWSVPIIGSEGAVLGTFAAYWGEPTAPTDYHMWIQRQFARLTQVAIERSQTIHRVTEVLASERQRIASAIHDDPIQVMTGAALRLQRLVATATPEQAPLLAETQAAVNSAVERLRHMLFELHPPDLEHEGLISTIEAYLEQSLDPVDIGWRVDQDLDSEPPLPIGSLIYRLAREAIANVIKHAGASEVTMTIADDDEGVGVRIVDDGHGFDTSRADQNEPGHMGLTNSRYLAQRAAGRWVISCPPTGGTVVEFWLPRPVVATPN